jgi:hypothetical protein
VPYQGTVVRSSGPYGPALSNGICFLTKSRSYLNTYVVPECRRYENDQPHFVNLVSLYTKKGVTLGKME